VDRTDEEIGALCSHMASFTTLRGSICEAEKVRFQSNLETEGGNKEGSNTLDGRNVALNHAFNVLFLGRPGVGKSQIINKVSRASPTSDSLLRSNRLYPESLTTAILLHFCQTEKMLNCLIPEL
jgi:GTPase involved in cell partitioning and DNA repair